MNQVPGTAASAPVVLIVVNVSWFFLSHRLELALCAARAGYDVHVATRVDSDLDRARIAAAGLTLHDVPFVRSGRDITGDLRSLALLVSLYRRLRPALVHLVTMKPVLLGGMAARLGGRPSVLAAMTGLGHSFTASGAWARVRRMLLFAGLRIAIPRTDRAAALFQNEDDRELMLRSGVFPPRNAVVIRGSGVDLAQFAPVPEPPGPVRIVLPARMIREKGILQFVEAARTVSRRHAHAQFLLAGRPDPGNPQSIGEEELLELCDGKAIQWLGYIADMPALLASCHIVCLPTYYGEGVPKSLIEAAAAGRPIVTTDTPGCRDIVRDGENGLLVATRDSVQLAAALDRLIADPALRTRMGAAGRRRAVSEFGLDAIVTATLQLYRQLTDNHASMQKRTA